MILLNEAIKNFGAKNTNIPIKTKRRLSRHTERESSRKTCIRMLQVAKTIRMLDTPEVIESNLSYGLKVNNPISQNKENIGILAL
jgi:hypothetical protein